MDDTSPTPALTFTVDTDRARLDVALIHRFLSGSSYWAQGIPLAVVERALDHSLCFGLYAGDEQVGFARLVTDHATFAYLADVFVLGPYRGHGLGKLLMAEIVAHPAVQGLRRWLLGTRDAHALYAQFGFRPLAAPERFMERLDAHVYERPLATLSGDGDSP